MAKKKTRSSKSAALNATGGNVRKEAARTVREANDFTRLLLSGNNLAMEKIMSQNKFGKISQDASVFGRDGMEAFIKSSNIFAKGCEDIFRQSMAMAQKAAEKQAQLMKDAMSSKTLNEWTETQAKIAQENFDDFMAGATKISELSARLMNETTQPFNAQVTKSMKKATESMAA